VKTRVRVVCLGPEPPATNAPNVAAISSLTGCLLTSLGSLGIQLLVLNVITVL
jgi:hypothetical protein